MSLNFGGMVPQSQVTQMAGVVLKGLRDLSFQQVQPISQALARFAQADYADNGQLDGSARNQFSGSPSPFAPVYNYLNQLDVQDDGQLNGSVILNAWQQGNTQFAYQGASDFTRYQQEAQRPQNQASGLNFQNILFCMVQGLASSVMGVMPTAQTQVTKQALVGTLNAIAQRQDNLNLLGPNIDPQTRQQAGAFLDAQSATTRFMFNNFDQIAGIDGDRSGISLLDLGRAFNFRAV